VKLSRTPSARVLSCHVTSVKAGALMTLLDEFQLAMVPVSFVYNPGRCLPTKVRAFIDLKSRRRSKADFTELRQRRCGSLPKERSSSDLARAAVPGAKLTSANIQRQQRART